MVRTQKMRSTHVCGVCGVSITGVSGTWCHNRNAKDYDVNVCSDPVLKPVRRAIHEGRSLVPDVPVTVTRVEDRDDGVPGGGPPGPAD